MDFRSTASTDFQKKAEDSVQKAINLTTQNNINEAINEYKNAMQFLIYASNSVSKPFMKSFYAERINQINYSLNQLEMASNFPLTRVETDPNTQHLFLTGQPPPNFNNNIQSGYPSYPTAIQPNYPSSNYPSQNYPSQNYQPPLNNQPGYPSQMTGVTQSNLYGGTMSLNYPQLGDIQSSVMSIDPTQSSFLGNPPTINVIPEPGDPTQSGQYQFQGYPQFNNSGDNITLGTIPLIPEVDPIQEVNQQPIKPPEHCHSENHHQTPSNGSSSKKDSSSSHSKRKSSGSRSKSKRSSSHVAISDRILNLENFKREGDLGRGSFGMVYLVKEKRTGKLYAVKELLTLDSAEEQKSFLREVEALAQAMHPAILHLHGFSMKISAENPVPAIVTEYLPGGSIQDVIDKKKRFNNTQKMISLVGICSAMKYLHDKLHIVHRDLKPANVMLNGNNEPVVGDFGLAKIMNHSQMRQTQAAGSPVYMAPELMERKEYTNKVDVYAFGVMCFELITETLAFSNVNSLIDLVNLVCRGSRPSFRGLNIQENFKELIKRCWDHDPSVRPSFADIYEELKCNLILEGTDMESYNAYLSKISHRKK
ncbi:hypothetical protein TRFO_04992 [Tritrichomonas foetus]|uniref:Protein kinase domain-containing protein n=1 Tax=Tritrichomonas foetus TaxID=1144522 RepID=A0A1J4KE37_9EUKA|nr:hypothetical protein TRFO_04992 [Tritrichomonas foetus]|eukprot:OHT07894.1 hypothetical protein TRFO_04992 [Tritrichomonas foetus]